MKKWISLLCACAMMLCSLAVTATAEPAAVEIAAGSVTAKLGDTVQIPVTLSENHYLVNTRFYITYDPALLELQVVNEAAECSYINDWNASLFTADAMWAGRLVNAGDLRVVYATSLDVGKTVGGTLFTLTFKVLAGAGKDIPVTITMQESSANDGTTDNGNDYTPVVNVTNGTVAVEHPKGDVNGDGIVNIADATMLFRYVNARVALNEEQLARADVVAPTGNVNIGDALVLFRYANGRLASL